MINALANCISKLLPTVFTHPKDTEQCYHLFGVVFLAT